MAWVEQGIKPEVIIASHDGTAGKQRRRPDDGNLRKGKPADQPGTMGSPDGRKAEVVDVAYVKRTLPVFPYPSVARYNGQGDWHIAENYTQTEGPVMPAYTWAGEAFFNAGSQLDCTAADGALHCEKIN